MGVAAKAAKAKGSREPRRSRGPASSAASPSKSSTALPVDQILCSHCGRGDNEGQLLLCDGCEVATHTYCCKPALYVRPSGEWFCVHCERTRSARRGTMSYRQRLTAAVADSLACASSIQRRLPMQDRPPAPPRAQPTAHSHGDGSIECNELRLLQSAPRLEFDRGIQQGTIFDEAGRRLAGAVYDLNTGFAVAGSELHACPDPNAINNRKDALPARVLTQANVEEDLCAPSATPPATESHTGTWDCLDANGAPLGTVLYLPKCQSTAADGGSLGGVADAAVVGVASAIEGAYVSDEKTGGGYIVAGNGE